jgi:hypothetical protein
MVINMKRNILLIFSLAFATALFSGCGADSGSASSGGGASDFRKFIDEVAKDDTAAAEAAQKKYVGKTVTISGGELILLNDSYGKVMPVQNPDKYDRSSITCIGDHKGTMETKDFNAAKALVSAKFLADKKGFPATISGTVKDYGRDPGTAVITMTLRDCKITDLKADK